MPELSQPALWTWDRLMAKVAVQADGCWLWTGTINGKGYGQIMVGGRLHLAHRLAWLLAYGDAPTERGSVRLTLDHLCRRRPCVRPSHLELVTNRENILRGTCPSAINATKTVCVNGHQFTASNTHVRKDGRRECRACMRERMRRFRARAVGRA